MDAYALAVPMLDGGEDPHPAVLEGDGAGAIGSPEDMGGVGGDGPLVGRGLRGAVAVRGEQAVLAQEAQHPFSGHPDAIEDPQAAPDLAMTLAGQRGACQVGANGGQEPLVRDRGLWGRVDRGKARVAVPAAGGGRSWSGARPRRHTPASRRRAGW
jgi:hypothetical protein